MDNAKVRADADSDGDAVEPPMVAKDTQSRHRNGSLGDEKKRCGGAEDQSRKDKRRPPAGGARREPKVLGGPNR